MARTKKDKKDKKDLKIATSFDMTPGIDSRAVDRDIEDYRRKYGSTKPDMKQIDKNIKRLRSKLKGV